jgi:hypothetical protein
VPGRRPDTSISGKRAARELTTISRTCGFPAYGLYGGFLCQGHYAILVVLCHSILLFDRRREHSLQKDAIGT